MTMGKRLAISIVFTMLANLCRGKVKISLQQTPAIQVLLAKENVTIYCNATFPQEYTDTTVSIYNIGGTLVNGRTHKKSSKRVEGNTTKISYQFNFQPIRDPHTATIFYYCRTAEASGRVIGTGTFIHIRDTGYVEHTDFIKAFLITSCCILGVLSLAGTILLLLWKKKGYPMRPPVKAHSETGKQKREFTSTSNRPEASTSGSVYTTLQHHSIEVYDTIEQDMKNQLKDSTQSSPVPPIPKHKPEVKKKPETQTVGKKKAADRKIQRAAAKGEIFDTVYENL